MSELSVQMVRGFSIRSRENNSEKLYAVTQDGKVYESTDIPLPNPSFYTGGVWPESSLTVAEVESKAEFIGNYKFPK